MIGNLLERKQDIFVFINYFSHLNQCVRLALDWGLVEDAQLKLLIENQCYNYWMIVFFLKYKKIKSNHPNRNLLMSFIASIPQPTAQIGCKVRGEVTKDCNCHIPFDLEPWGKEQNCTCRWSCPHPNRTARILIAVPEIKAPIVLVGACNGWLTLRKANLIQKAILLLPTEQAWQTLIRE